jgi:hypothetical protein
MKLVHCLIGLTILHHKTIIIILTLKGQISIILKGLSHTLRKLHLILIDRCILWLRENLLAIIIKLVTDFFKFTLLFLYIFFKLDGLLR